MAKKKTNRRTNLRFPVVIKRYGNRRLYNTETKGYVNYEELAEIVRDGNDVR